jgi:hypothetical protein
LRSASGNFKSILETPVFSLLGETNGLLNFLQGYILNAGAAAKIEISTNGGTSYNTILEQHTGPDTLGYSSGAVSMKAASLDLRNYIGLSNLRIRFSYTGSVKSAWVLDNVIVPSQGLDLIYTWAAPETLNTTNGPIVIATPQTTTTYNVTTVVGGCPGGTKQVTVNVKPTLITSATIPEQTICSGSPISTINFSSNLPSTTYKWYQG